MSYLPQDWITQDWGLVSSALSQLAADPRECTDQEDRAYELIEGIAVQQGLNPSELIRQLE